MDFLCHTGVIANIFIYVIFLGSLVFKISRLKYGSIGVGIAIMLLSVIVFTSNFNSSESALAQQQHQQNSNNTNTNRTTTTNQTDTFQAKGQIDSLASDIMLGKPNSNNTEMWILGGNWEIGVSNGNFTNFVTNILMTQIDGTGLHHHKIQNFHNVTGALIPFNSDKKIILDGNYSQIGGIADISVNDNIKWKDVPISISLRNGNTITFNIDPAKTDYHFKGLPVFGIVQSLIDKNGKDLLNRQ